MENDAPTSEVTIAVHPGKFHCDDAMCCALLRLLPRYQKATVIRTTDPAILNNSTIVCDVGGEYEPLKLRFDHHQKGYFQVFSSSTPLIKMAACGQVYKHFGREIIRQLSPQLESRPDDVELIYQKMYGAIIKEIDADDNGISQLPAGSNVHLVFSPRTTLSIRVSSMNPQWNEDSSTDAIYSRFMEAVDLCKKEFLTTLRFFAKTWLPAREIVKSAYSQRPNPYILVLEPYCPFNDHLHDMEKNPDEKEPVLYVISYQAERQSWHANCTKPANDFFANRLSFPQDWAGLRDNELENVSQIPGSQFVHVAKFIAANKTLEGILEMCRKSVALQHQQYLKAIEAWDAERKSSHSKSPPPKDIVSKRPSPPPPPSGPPYARRNTSPQPTSPPPGPAPKLTVSTAIPKLTYNGNVAFHPGP
ncbi:putative metal-dependent protein hydrolase [Blattamonas nauphoetae]|uniref:Metal-dependent protein hydrolase n=1 Tax=Blattamonas nauphoetae TaxID=2049346 RepID=A0ABQ9YED7_9EUKA|nr:putative metal-dependent protein hydrolase [Blattamonas nauphoetae]